MIRSNWLYIAVMFAVSYTIRILPLTLIRKPIKNQFIQSFLYYVPYVTLAVMTFPAIVNATQSPAAGAVALVVGIAAAWFGASLFQVSVACCAGVGGSMLIIGSAAGVVVMGLEKITFGWYMKRISLIAFAGYMAGILIYWVEKTFIGL